MPVEILGMNDTTFAGAEFLVTENEDEAKEISNFKKKTYQAQKFYQMINQNFLIKRKKKMNLTLLLNQMYMDQAKL